jgi:serine/threonine protein kinase
VSIEATDFDELAACCESLYEAKAQDEIAAAFGELSTAGERYRDAQEIGVGGMKRVSNVFDVASERRLAMAVVREDLDRSYDEALLREARLTALLDHPNVISIHDIGLTAQNRVFFTMDLKPGQSLDQILASHRDRPQAFSLEQRLRIFSGVCDAVAYAHSKQVIHLDVKPANVQIGEFGEVLLCDWGLAKIIDTDDQEETLDLRGSVAERRDMLNGMTAVGRIKGTPGFMAPEQILADGEKDEQSDVFALGCLLHALCTLRRPFSGSPEQAMKRTVDGKSEPLPAEVPKSLAAVIQRAITVDKAARYASVTALSQEIDGFRKGFSTLAEGAGIGKEALLFIRRNRRPVAIACLSLCIIAGLTGFYIANLRASNLALERRTQELIDARKSAEDQRDQAERARLAEVEANRRVQSLNLAQIHQQMKNVIYEWPVAAAQAAAEHWELQRQEHGDTPEIMAGLQECFFILQLYDQVLEISPQTEAMQQIRALAERHVGSQPGFLSSEALRDLAAELTKADQFSLAINTLLGDASRVGREPRNYLPAVVAILAVLNPEWDAERVEYVPEEGILRLSGAKLTRLSSDTENPRTPIRLLHVKHLDLRGSGIADLQSVRRLNLYSIDIRDTPVATLEILKWTRNLQQIIVEKGRFPKAHQIIGESRLDER